MIGKSLLAAAALTATMTLAMPMSQAKADVDVDIGIGFGGFVPGHYGGGYGHGYDDDYDYDYDYGHYPVYQPRRISCNTGRRIVDNSGFNRVRAVDCDLPGYRYTARRNGQKYMVRVNGRGVITGVSRFH
jgi:hypothetical protein